MRPATAEDADEWQRVVESSPEGTLFHSMGWLRAIEQTGGRQLIPLVAEQDGAIIGIAPVFVHARLGFSLYSAPAQKSLVGPLGPVFAHRTAAGAPADERLCLSFLDAIFGYLQRSARRGMLVMKAVLPYGGARAATWRGLRVAPRYTYVVLLDRSPEAILASFAERSRKYVRRAERMGLTCRISPDLADARRVRHLITSRYREQGFGAPFSDDYLAALWAQFGGRQLWSSCVEKDGEFVTGMLCVESDRTLCCISGAPRFNFEGHSVNEFLHWNTMRLAQARGMQEYDLMGANTQRLIDFKMKLRPELREYFHIESDGILPMAARFAYARALR